MNCFTSCDRVAQCRSSGASSSSHCQLRLLPAMIAASLVLAAVLVPAAPATATAYTWTGAFTTEWNFGLNWSPSGNNFPNSATDTAAFNGQGLGTININPSVSAQLLSFSNPTGSYTLTSNAGVTLSGVSSIDVAAGVTGTQTINLANVATGSLLLKNSGLLITNNSTAVGTTLRIGPNTVISPSTAATTFPDLYVDGVGTTEISGSYVSKNCCGSASGNLYKFGPGTLILSNPTNAYYGGTSISAGTLLLGSGTAIPTGTDVTVVGQFNISNLSNTATTAIGELFLADTGSFRVPSGSGDYYLSVLRMRGGELNFAGTSNFWLHFTNANAGININPDFFNPTTSTWIGSGASRVQNDTANPLPITVNGGSTPSGIDLDADIILSNGGTNSTFIKQGAGTMRLTNPGNTANLNVVAGKLRVDDMANLGSGVITVNGGTLQYGGPGETTTKNLTIEGTATILVSTPGANLNYNGVMNQISFASLNVLGPGTGSAPSTLSLINNNSYYGNTSIYDNAILAIPTLNNIGDASPIGTNLFSTGIVLGTTDTRGTLLLTGTSAGLQHKPQGHAQRLVFFRRGWRVRSAERDYEPDRQRADARGPAA